MALHDPHFQPAPWTLHGKAIVGLKWVSSDIARRLVPPDANVLCMWPGRTLAILYLAQYLQSPVGAYREIIVAPALIWRRGRIGFWISHIFVDHSLSLTAGRAIWALPKQMASMEWTADRISSNGPQLKLQAVIRPPGASIRLPFAGAAMSKYGPEESWFAVRGAARVGSSRANIESIDDLGIGELGFNGTMRVLVCSEMQVTIGRPIK